MNKTLVRYTLSCAFILMAASTLKSQDTSTSGFKYVVLHYDHNNNVAPDFQKFRTKLEDGIKDLMLQSKIPMLKYQKEATELKLKDCDTAVCTYYITYSPGMMLNANITCALSFTDCNKTEIYTTNGKKMVGAVAAADSYLKVFAKLIGPDLLAHLKHKH